MLLNSSRWKTIRVWFSDSWNISI